MKTFEYLRRIQIHTMQIEISQLLEGARKAKGLAVIIDVFRAFSTACYVTNNNVERIYPVGAVEDAFEIKRKNKNCILLGERNETKVEGFDFGNSPTHIQNYDFSGKIVAHTTSSGTQGIANATGADEILTGSFVNVGAIINYIKQKQPSHVSLVCMGYATLYPCQEDTFCAEYIKAKLEGKPVNFDALVEKLRIGDGARLLDPKNHEHSPATDFNLCLDLSRFDFVLKVEKENGINYLRRIDSKKD